MKFVTLSLAITITIWIFIYTLSYAYTLIQSKNYRGGIGVLLLGITAVALPMYALFFQ
ncbi:MAG: hypothetical protein WA118_06500 [Carboxydocellales bacterium]